MRGMIEVLDSADFLEEPDKKLWQLILSKIDESVLQDPQGILKRLLEQELSSLQGKEGDVFSPWMIKIPYKELKDFGSPDDIESPLGFLKVSLPFPQDDSEHLKIYAPCAPGVIERWKYGPELMVAYSWNVNKKWDIGKIRDMYNKSKNKVDKNREEPSKVRRIFRFFGKVLNKTKAQFVPFYSLSSSQHFYEEGRRFYFHPKVRYLFIGSASPGIMIPEEYYGKEIYFPGITRVIPPGSLSSVSGPGFETWRFLLREKLLSGRSIENPFRTIYFDEGLGTTKALITYSVFWEEARKNLKSKVKIWEPRGLKDEYLDDAAAVMHFFFSKWNIRVLKLSIEPEKSRHYAYTLVSDGYWFISERSREMKKIRKGRAINIPAIENVVDSMALLNSLVSLLQTIEQIYLTNEQIYLITIGPLVMKGIESVVRRIFQGRMDLIEQEVEKYGSDLKQYIYKRYGGLSKDKIRRWIEDDILS